MRPLEAPEIGLGLAEAAEDLIFVAVEEADGDRIVAQSGLGVDPGALIAVDQVRVEPVLKVGSGLGDEGGHRLTLVGTGSEQSSSGVGSVGGRDAEQVEQAGEVGVAKVARGAVEAVGQVVPAVEQPEDAVPGLEEGWLDDLGVVGEGLAKAFGVEGTVIVPGFGGPLGEFVAEGHGVMDATIGPDRFDDDPLEPPELGGTVGAILRDPVPLAFLDGRGHLVGEDDAVTGQAVLQGVAGDLGFSGLGLRAGRFLGVAAVGFNLAKAGHDRELRLG